MSQIAVYPGTFDPITNGHVDLIQRAAHLFDEVVVAVAKSARKTPQIDYVDRMQLVEEVFSPIKNIKVELISGLLVDFAKVHHATILVRGLRAVSDFDYEFQLAGMNRQMASHIETVFLPATQEHAYVSATIVREILSLEGDIAPFVPPAVVTYLKKKK